MAGKGGKGLIAAKKAAGMDREKKQPVTRSSRAGLQVGLVPFLRPASFLFGSSLCPAPLRHVGSFLLPDFARRLRFVRSWVVAI